VPWLRPQQPKGTDRHGQKPKTNPLLIPSLPHEFTASRVHHLVIHHRASATGFPAAPMVEASR